MKARACAHLHSSSALVLSAPRLDSDTILASTVIYLRLLYCIGTWVPMSELLLDRQIHCTDDQVAPDYLIVE